MRYFLPLLVLAAQAAHAQCCPYVEPVTVLPANPTAADDVRLVFRAMTGNRGQKVGSVLTRSGTAFTFTACYWSGMLTQPQSYADTVRVGQLPAGSYSIAFVAKESSDPQQCLERQRNGNFRTFRVSGPDAAPRDANPTRGLLYPIPAAGRQLNYRPTDTSRVAAFQLYDAAGRTCFARPAEAVPYDAQDFRLDLPALPAGTYMLRVQRTGQPPSTHRVVLQ